MAWDGSTSSVIGRVTCFGGKEMGQARRRLHGFLGKISRLVVEPDHPHGSALRSAFALTPLRVLHQPQKRRIKHAPSVNFYPLISGSDESRCPLSAGKPMIKGQQ